MKKLFAFALVSPLFTLVSYTQKLQPFNENGKYGFKSGERIIIQPKYEYASDFSEEKAAVKLNGKWGFVDRDGNVVVEPKYAKVEKFNNGFARFYKGRKFGLLNENGNEIVGAVCDDVYLNYNGGILISDGKQAWFSKESGKVACSFKYDIIKINQDFVECRDSLGTDYNYYMISGKLLAEHCKRSEMFYYSYDAPFLDINMENKAFLVDTAGKQVSDNYFAVDVEFVSYYRPDPEKPGSNLIIRCFLNGETDEMKLMRDDGYQFEGVFTNWEYVNDALSVVSNGVNYQLDEEGKLIAQKYKRVVNVYDHLALTDYNGNQILAMPVNTERHLEHFQLDTFLIDTFATIRPLFVQSEYYGYNESNYYDEMNDRYVRLNYDEIIEVEGLNENKGKYALYSLYLKKLVTPYDNHMKEYREDLSDDNNYCFTNENGIFGAVVNNKVLPYKYSSIDRYNRENFVFTDTLGNKSFFSKSSGNWTDIPVEYQVLNSLKYGELAPIAYFDEETGEAYTAEAGKRLFREFPVLSINRGETPKYGWIDNKGRLVEPQFDSISEDLDFVIQEAPEPIIIVWENGKCGAYNLDLGWISKPVHDSLLKFNSDQFTWTSRAKVPGKPFYLSSTGKYFAGTSFEPEFYKENGKTGARDYTYINDEERTNVLISPVYKTLAINYELPYLIEAQNAEKKFGVLHLETGDTLVPFNFTKIASMNDYYDLEDNYRAFSYEIYDKKGFGMYNLVSRNTIPPVFSNIHFAIVADASMFYVHSNGKVGLYAADFMKLLDCEYDGICVREINDHILVFAIKGDKVYGFNYTFEQINNQNPKNNAFDYVVGAIGYRKNDDGYDAFDIVSLDYLGSSKTVLSSEEENADFEIIEQNGKLALKGKETGKMVISDLRLVEFVDGEYVVTFEEGNTFYQSCYNKKNKYKASEW